jgi:hypothetical protein
LTHAEYKALEAACRAFHETTHTTVTGYYHKSFRIPLGQGNQMEFHGPAVKAAEGDSGAASQG